MEDERISGVEREVSLMKSRIEQQIGRQRSKQGRQADFARDRIGRRELLNPGDVARLAINLHQIVAAAHKAGVSKSKLAAEAGMADGNGKSGRFYEYTMDPQIAEGARRQRVKRLVRRPDGYLRVTEAAAQLRQIDSDQLVIELVHGTTLAEGMDQLPDHVEPEHLVTLAAALQGQAERIAQEHGLDWYFRAVDDYGLAPTSSDGWEEDHDAYLWTFATLPWVELGGQEVACFRGRWWPKSGGKITKPEDVVVTVVQRIALVFAPFNQGKRVRAYFAVRPGLAFEGMARKGASVSDRWLSPIVCGMPDEDGSFRGRHGTLKVLEAEAIPFISNCYLGAILPGDDIVFVEVTPGSIVDLLEAGLSWADLPDAAMTFPDPSMTRSPPGSRAALLERALIKGDLIEKLERQTANSVASLRAFVDRRGAEIDDMLAKMVAGERP